MTEEIILTKTTKKQLISEILDGVELLIIESTKKEILKKEWLTTKEVMSLLKVTSTTMWKYDNQGITKPQRIGNRKRYAKSDIMELLTSRKSK